MADERRAIEDLAFLAERFNGILALIPALKEAGSTRNMAQQLMADVQRLRKEQEKIIAGYKATAESEAKERAAAIVAKAEADAKDLVDGAKKRAADHFAAAKGDADAYVQRMSMEADRHKADSVLLQKAHDEVLKRISELESHRDKILAELRNALGGKKVA